MSGRSGTATCALGANPSAIKRGRRLPYCLLLIALLLGTAILRKDGGAGFPTAKPRSNSQWAHLYAALPMSFEANRGQTDPSVNFLSRGRGYALFLTGGEAVLTLKNPSSAVGGKTPPASAAALRLKLLGANAHAVVTGRDELPGKANYFIGNDPSKWRTNVPTFAKVKYESVYPGVDLVYYGAQGGELEYDFVVAPGADPKAISLGVETGGHAPLQINSEGDLIVRLQSGNVQLHKPVVYQEAESEVRGARFEVQNGARNSKLETRNSSNRQLNINHRQVVEGHYALDAQNHVRFDLGPYDHNRPLVIDPVLVYATYIGGSGGDVAYSIAVDSYFDAYIAGVTNSSDFPIKSGEQSAYGGEGDAFVTKMNAAGSQLIFSTYLGGSGSDTATAIALSSGSTFITGYTSSTNFPTKVPVSTANPFQLTYGGGSFDAFVTELSTDGSTVVYSSYLGGSGADFGQGIAVDSSGNAYVTGSTQSSSGFPTVNALQSVLNGSQNAFVTKVNNNGEALVYSTYLGGSEADSGQSIQVDNSGNAYIAGYTFSSDFLERNVPLGTPIQSTIGGAADAFVAELSFTGTTLSLPFSTFLGGTGDDRAYGLALDSTQTPNIYITGSTVSTNFPTTSGVLQPALKGSSDAFVCKLNNAGSTLVFSTYLGGSNADQGNAIAVIPTGQTNAGAVFVTGFTESSDFPTQDPIQAILGLTNNNLCGSAPCADAFISQLTPQGTGLTYSTYLGGNGPDFGESIALDTTGDPYITGSTSSTNFPATASPNSVSYTPTYKSTLTGTAGNAFIAKMDPADIPNISIVPNSLNFGNETISVTSTLLPITIVNPSTEPLTISQIQINPIGPYTTIFTETDNCVGTPTVPSLPPGSYCTIYVAFTPNSTGSVTDTLTITDNQAGVTGSEQTISLTGSGVTAATSVTVQPTSLSFSNQTVGTISPPQNITITNTGTEVLNITGFSTGTSGDYAWTAPNCLALNNTLNVGQSCTVSVTFTPTASGTRSGSLRISDTATGSPQTVSLTGTGAAAFTLTSPSGNNPTLIGSTQTTFVIVATGATGFSNAIALACSAGTTCVFSTNPVFVGQPTTLTVSNLTSTLSNPYAFQVLGTSGSQSNSLNMNIQFEDFTLTATPSIFTVQAGYPASYNIIVNPLYGFNQQIQLICELSTLPPDSTCTFNPDTPTPNGLGPLSVPLSISTVKYIATNTHALPRWPNSKLPPLMFGLLSLAGLASLALGNRRRGHKGWLGSVWLGVRLVTLSMILALNLALVACRGSTLVQSGSTPGNYTVTLYGQLLSNTTVVRYTTLAVAVTSTNPNP